MDSVKYIILPLTEWTVIVQRACGAVRCASCCGESVDLYKYVISCACQCDVGVF